LTDTFTVSTSSDLTSLSSADQWDIAIVTSENKTYVLSVAPYSTASNWKEILAPTGWVTSFNWQTWAVTYTAPVSSVNGSTWAVTVLESQTKVFPMPEAWDSVSDILTWLWAGKVAILKDGNIFYQIVAYNTIYGWIAYSYIQPANNITTTDSLKCYTIYYDTTTLEIDTKDDRDYILVPTWWTNWQVLTATSSTSVDWENPTWTTYNAWEWIEIKNWDDYSAMQWPAPSGFHVPSKDEWVALCGILTSTFSMTSDNTTIETYLKMPMAGYRDYNDAVVNSAGSRGHYWSCTPSSTNNAFFLRFGSSDLNPQLTSIRAIGLSVRCFKDMPVIPTASWTTLYDGSSIASWAWVFYNATDGLISVSGDWQTWYTIMDKNLWATIVYNSWDTLSNDNCGDFFQWWNNYGFSWYGLDLIKISSTQVDASNYWPWNYYSSDTFITWSYNWSSVQNDNLRWWVTWVVTLDNAITNTWVLVSDQPNNILTSWMKIRAWTEANYQSLANFDSNTLYLTVE